jgi:UDPglucose 6-dehydrogenase
MQPGPGYGGSCFPKDTMALTHIARDSGYPTNIIEAVIKSNDSRKSNMAKKIINACGGDVRGKEIAVLGLTFKANTDDMRYSPSLVIIPELIKAGAKIRAFDPVGMDEARKALLPPLPVGEGRGEGSEAISEVNALTLTLSHRERELLQFCESANEALKGADACAILTEWQEFRDIDLKTTKQLMKVPLIVDLRNLLDRKKAVGLGYQYVSIGR